MSEVVINQTCTGELLLKNTFGKILFKVKQYVCSELILLLLLPNIRAFVFEFTKGRH